MMEVPEKTSPPAKIKKKTNSLKNNTPLFLIAEDSDSEEEEKRPDLMG